MRKKALITNKVLIIGGGENGGVIKNILSLDPKLHVCGFLDDAKEGGEVVGKVADFLKFHEEGYYFFVSIGTNSTRQKVFNRLKDGGARFVNAIHPDSRIESGVKLGENVMVGAFSFVNVGSSVGDNAFINNHCNLDHDCVLGAHSHMAPGSKTGGGVKIGECTWVGIGALIRDHRSVGDNVMVGMGAVVVSDIPSNITVVGNPARPFEKKN